MIARGLFFPVQWGNLWWEKGLLEVQNQLVQKVFCVWKLCMLKVDTATLVKFYVPLFAYSKELDSIEWKHGPRSHILPRQRSQSEILIPIPVIV